MSKKVIIIGGGVIGMSTAFHLAEKGISDISIIEKDYIGSGSSSQAAGIVTCHQWNSTSITARMKTIDIFEKFSQILTGYTFQQVGCLNLSNEEDYNLGSELRDLQDNLGAYSETYIGNQLTEKFPDVILKDNEYGVLDTRGGYSEPHFYIPALKKKIESMGVKIFEKEELINFNFHGENINKVITFSKNEKLEKKYDCDYLVVAVNAWTNLVLSPIDFKIPMKNFIHERFVTKPFDRELNLPAINDRVFQSYIRGTEDNRIMVGTSQHNPDNYNIEDNNFNIKELKPFPNALDFLKDSFKDRVPIIQNKEWDYHTVGLISVTADATPVIGPIPNLNGVFLCSNFHSGGFAYNPVAGMLIAEHVVDGKTSIDSDFYLPSRFKNFKTKEYLSKTHKLEDLEIKRH
jgi:glycine/D-amino acid oxidase-like deaminating enzyme